MARFSDAPYFILEDFLDTIVPYGYDRPSSSFLRGPNMLMAENAFNTDMYVKYIDGGAISLPSYVRIGVRPIQSYMDGNIFKFYIDDITIDGEIIDFDDTTVTLADFAGMEIYFREDGRFYSFIEANSAWTNFVSTNKPFIYFGKLFGTGDRTFNIVYEGMKDYILRALPENNRTVNLTEFMRIFYDKVYNEVYNLTKNVNTLQDPYEVDFNYLRYIAEMYNDTINDDIDSLYLREYVANIVHFLKHKGTYSSIHIIWQTLLFNTINTLTVYERWHDWGFSGIPLAQFVDYPMVSKYDITPTTCAGDTWFGIMDRPGVYTDRVVSPSATEGLWFEDTDGVDWVEPDAEGTIVYPTYSEGHSELSPHYKVQMDLSCEALGDDYIINSDIINNLVNKWEIMRPVCKYAHYHILLSPITTLTGDYTSLYTSIKHAGECNTKCCTGVVSPITGSYIYNSVSSLSVWVINHELNNAHVFIQCYDTNNNMVLPTSIVPIDDNNTRITFARAVNGSAFMSEAELTHTQAAPSASWEINYTPPSGAYEDTLIQFETYTDKDVFLPDTVTVIDDDSFTATMSEPISGYAIGVEGTKFDHAGATKTWYITHSLDKLAALVQVFKTDDTMVIPKNITLQDRNNVIITFEEATGGYAIIKGIGQVNTEELVMADISYCKVGSEGGSDWNPVINNDIEDSSSVTYTDVSTTDDESRYYVTVEAHDDTEKSITEIGLFDSNDDIIFYTYCSELYKISDTNLDVYYRITKQRG